MDRLAQTKTRTMVLLLTRCRLVLWVLWGALSSGCFEALTRPMTAAGMTAFDSWAALVHYPGQADASPVVCDLRAQGPRLTALHEDTRAALVAGLRERQVPPALWRRCVASLLRSAPPEASASLLDDIGRAYRELLRSAELELSPRLQERLDAMHQIYLGRRPGSDGHAAVLGRLFADLRRALSGHHLRPVAARFGEDLLAAVDIERGLWLGRSINGAMINALATAGQEALLQRFAERRRAGELREQARLIRRCPVATCAGCGAAMSGTCGWWASSRWVARSRRCCTSTGRAGRARAARCWPR